jgi:hypothetical protein
VKRWWLANVTAEQKWRKYRSLTGAHTRFCYKHKTLDCECDFVLRKSLSPTPEFSEFEIMARPSKGGCCMKTYRMLYFYTDIPCIYLVTDLLDTLWVEMITGIFISGPRTFVYSRKNIKFHQSLLLKTMKWKGSYG